MLSVPHDLRSMIGSNHRPSAFLLVEPRVLDHLFGGSKLESSNVFGPLSLESNTPCRGRASSVQSFESNLESNGPSLGRICPKLAINPLWIETRILDILSLTEQLPLSIYDSCISLTVDDQLDHLRVQSPAELT